jgi:hypothetical protein
MIETQVQERRRISSNFLNQFEKRLTEGMVARTICIHCKKIKEVTAVELDEIVQFQNDSSILALHKKGEIDWKEKVIMANRCFNMSLGGRINFPGYCGNPGTKELKIRIIDL